MTNRRSPLYTFFILSILLILAWKTAGYYGLDRWILPRIGMTWQSYGPRRVRSTVRMDQVPKVNP